MKRVKYSNIETEELIKLLRFTYGTKIPIDSIFFSLFIQQYVHRYLADDEVFEIQDKHEKSVNSPMVFNLLIPKTHYNIDLKTTTLSTLSLLLDIFITNGISTATLAGIGKVGQFVYKIEEANGEICNYHAVGDESGNGLTFDELFNKLSKRVCPYPNLNCSHFDEGFCNINEQELMKNVRELEKKLALDIVDYNKLKLRK